MHIKSIELNNFRNYDNEVVYLDKNLNVVVGNNAQGKTNLLESIYLASIGKSPRTSKEKELIRWSSTFAKVTMEYVKHSNIHKKLEIFLSNTQNKSIKINGYYLKKISQLLGEIYTVYFSPDELNIVKNGPNERRKFLDIAICQFDKNYFYNLNKYFEVLDQRNRLLKSSNNAKTIADTLAIWDEQLAIFGAKIVYTRLKFVNILSSIASQIHKELTENKEVLRLEYTGVNDVTEDNIKAKLLQGLIDCRDKDISLGYTNVGPQRDDIKLIVNEIDIRSFGSQGQQRTVALSLKLAELEVIKSETHETPILLLDDVLSELDNDRQLKLISKVKEYQTIITCTEFKHNIDYNEIKINDGKLIK